MGGTKNAIVGLAVVAALLGCEVASKRERTVWVDKVRTEYKSGIFGGWFTVYETRHETIEIKGLDHDVAPPCSVTFGWTEFN